MDENNLRILPDDDDPEDYYMKIKTKEQYLELVKDITNEAINSFKKGLSKYGLL